MKYIFIIFILNFTKNAYSFDWCSLNCNKGKHITCERMGQCDAESPCYFVTLDQNKFVEAHNEYRSKVALGEEPLIDGLKVANMMALVWNDDLAYTASCNLAACGPMKHDSCRGVPEYPAAGQNLWAAGTTGSGDCKTMALGAVKNWYNEIKDTTIDHIRELAQGYSSDGKTGHFTQVIWADTEAVGCALTEKKDQSGINCVLACNYGPAGNMLNGKMLIEGEACSKCPEGVTCGEVKEGLCGAARRTTSNPIFHLISGMLLVLLFKV